MQSCREIAVLTETMPVLRYRASDHGKPVSEWDFDIAAFEPGYKFELIDGRLYVAAEPDPPEVILETWLADLLRGYSKKHPDVTNYVFERSRVYVPARQRMTIPEPDIACFADFPLARALGRGFKWNEVSPLIVVEVLVAAEPDKDLVRNVELYLQVPSIREYWVLDGRVEPARPQLIQHRRHGGRWIVKTFEAGSTFTTKLLPGFELVLDPLAGE
jgi:Uma2 family endonuclease